MVEQRFQRGPAHVLGFLRRGCPQGVLAHQVVERVAAGGAFDEQVVVEQVLQKFLGTVRRDAGQRAHGGCGEVVPRVQTGEPEGAPLVRVEGFVGHGERCCDAEVLVGQFR